MMSLEIDAATLWPSGYTVDTALSPYVEETPTWAELTGRNSDAICRVMRIFFTSD